MSIESRIEHLANLGNYIREDGQKLKEIKFRAEANNPWFTQENINTALKAVADTMLESSILEEWVSRYTISEVAPKRVGLILAGNIPLVGFHDVLSVYISGHHSKIKSSSKDSLLIQHLIEELIRISEDPQAFEFVEQLKEIDAIIATGSNHSASQFERYFAKYPNIIRRNRNAIAVLSGNESREDIIALGKDIFQYYGLGCRNVSKIYLPGNFDKTFMMEVLHENFSYLINLSKYKNNYDYNYANYLLNGDDFLASGAVIMRRHEDIISRIACLHYEEYDDIGALEQKLREQLDHIQCIASKATLGSLATVGLGDCQRPKIDDYADGVDTMEFLIQLS